MFVFYDQHLEQHMSLAIRPTSAIRTPLVTSRQKFFTGTVMHSVLSVLYFALVLALRKDQLRWSVVVLGMAQCMVLITGFWTAQMMLHM